MWQAKLIIFGFLHFYHLRLQMCKSKKNQADVPELELDIVSLFGKETIFF